MNNMPRSVFPILALVALFVPGVSYADTDQATASPLPETVQASAMDSLPHEVPTEEISLEAAIAVALEENIDAALARADEAIASIKKDRGSHALLPVIKADAGFTHTDGVVQGSFGDFKDINASGHRLGLAITYGVNIGTQIKELAARRYEMEAAVFNTLAAEQKLILRVIELYENLVLARAGVDIAIKFLADAEMFERITRARADAGVGSGSDLARAELNSARSRSQLEEAHEVWRQTSITLAVVLRKDPEILMVPRETQPETWAFPESLNSITAESVLEKRPDIQALRQETHAATERIQAEQWNLYGPTLYAEAQFSGIGGKGNRSVPDRGDAVSNAAGSLSRAASSWQGVLAGTSAIPSAALGSFGRAFYDYRDLFRDDDRRVGLRARTNFSIGLVWTFSLEERDRIREIKAIRDRTQLRTKQIEELALGELRAAQSAVESNTRQIAHAKSQLNAAESSHSIAIAQFREGTAIALEVLDAQQSVAQARLRLAQYIVEQNLAQARFLTAAGLANETSILTQEPSRESVNGDQE